MKILNSFYYDDSPLSLFLSINHTHTCRHLLSLSFSTSLFLSLSLTHTHHTSLSVTHIQTVFVQSLYGLCLSLSLSHTHTHTLIYPFVDTFIEEYALNPQMEYHCFIEKRYYLFFRFVFKWFLASFGPTTTTTSMKTASKGFFKACIQNYVFEKTKITVFNMRLEKMYFNPNLSTCIFVLNFLL